jgi:tRNA(Arg) A34 adenosine deaminase TadA
MDFTRHAELNLVVEAYKNFDREVLTESTLYASTAPCMMCASAIKYTGITRVVYGVRYETFAELVPRPHKYVSIEEVYEFYDESLEAIGGVLEEECLDSYKYWPEEQ